MKPILPSFGGGDHICLAFASSEELYAEISTFLRDGIRRGERCYCFFPRERRDELSAALSKRGCPVTHLQSTTALLMGDPPSLANLAEGAKSSAYARMVGRARAEGFSGARYITFHLSQSEEADLPFCAHESALAQSLADTRTSALCVYDRRVLSPDKLHEILGHHDMALIQGKACRTHFPPPSQAQAEPRFNDWVMENLLAQEEARETLETQHSLLIHEAARLEKNDEQRSHEIESMRRALESRDRLLLTIARWMSRPLPALCAHLDDFTRDSQLAHLRDAFEPCGDYLAALVRLSRGMDEIAGFLQMHVTLRPETLDMVKVAEHAVAEMLEQPTDAGMAVQLIGVKKLEGKWDRLRLAWLFQSLIRTARDQGFGEKVLLGLVDLNTTARIQVEFHSPFESAGALLACRVAEVCRLDRPVHESESERLGVAMWPARELVRIMGGTLGISTWADARVMFTIDLPKSVQPPRTSDRPRSSDHPMPSHQGAGIVL